MSINNQTSKSKKDFQSKSPINFAQFSASENHAGSCDRALGKFTKSQSTPVFKGFQRSHDFILQDQSAKLLPKERVCNCLKKRINKKKNRTVMYNESRKKTHWGNVQRCGSVWFCPVCAKVITEKRRAEMAHLLSYWNKQDNSDVKLMTLTFSHSKTEPLKVLLSKLKHALSMFFGHRKFKELSAKCNIKHKVRSLEVTYGSNGWHPHFHILLLTNDTKDLAYAYRDELAKLWMHCCVAKGLKSPSMEHGLDIRDGKYAEKYVAKWGLEQEMTKGNVKKGRKESLSPFDLLQLSIENKEVFGKEPVKLWQEFAIAMKGKRQLVWGRGLKKLVGIDEKDDEEIINETDLESIELREVECGVFALLCKYQKRHTFLECLKRDYEYGTFGNGEAEKMLLDIVETEYIEITTEQ